MKNLKKTLITTIAVGVIGVATAGAAVAAPSNCRAGYMCGYYNASYANDHFDVGTYSADLRTYTHFGHGNWDNQFSSAFNNGTQCTVYLWQGYNFTGLRLTILRGNGYPSLGTVGFGNNVSSVRFCTG